MQKKAKKYPKVTVIRGPEFLPGNPGGSLPADFTSPLAFTEMKGGMCAVNRSKHPLLVVLVKKTVLTRETSGGFSVVIIPRIMLKYKWYFITIKLQFSFAFCEFLITLYEFIKCTL